MCENEKLYRVVTLEDTTYDNEEIVIRLVVDIPPLSKSRATDITTLMNLGDMGTRYASIIPVVTQRLS